ncbi:hypothetical protein DRP77_00790 [Candidatus Poribacteria bacterium]|nr:MAG: hypothetical protein DRP77_00790 [Candidatus Poribacteria bacterium]
MFRRAVLKARRYFLTGLLALLPTIVVVLLIFKLVAPIDTFILSRLSGIPSLRHLARIPGLGLILAVGFIILVGAATHSYIARKIAGYWERLIFKIPFLSKIYSTVRQIADAFMQSEGKMAVFKRVVLIEYPREGIYAIGFVTSEGWWEVAGAVKKPVLHVFIPTTPNPTSGFLLIVPEDQVIPLDMSVEDGLKMIISAGVLVPKERMGRLFDDKGAYKEGGKAGIP